MHDALSLYLLAVLLSLGCLVLGELVSKNDLSAFLSSHKNLSIFFDIIKAYPGGLDGVPFMAATFLIPDNQAFDKLTDWDLDNEAQAINILRYHIFPNIVPVSTTKEGIPIFAPTLMDGARVIIHRQSDDEVVFTSGADRRSTLLEGDIRIADGLIQVIDTVMMPPPGLVQICRDYTPLSAFLGALYLTNLSEQIITSKEVTIFAPNNAAFQRTAGTLSKLSMSELTDVIKFHIVPGTVLYSTDLVNDTTLHTLDGKKITGHSHSVVTVAGNNRYVVSGQIVDPDILIDFGVVHMLGDVLNPAKPDAHPVPTSVKQAPAFELSGSTSTGNRIPVPFTSALPCTTCEADDDQGRLTPTDNGGDRALAPKCTGLVDALGFGMLGFGVLDAVGVL